MLFVISRSPLVRGESGRAFVNSASSRSTHAEWSSSSIKRKLKESLLLGDPDFTHVFDIWQIVNRL